MRGRSMDGGKTYWLDIIGSYTFKSMHASVVYSVNRLLAYCKGGNFNIHIWAWVDYFIC